MITTGDDDLRGDSSATATLQDANGSSLQVLTLKAESDPSWDNNTTHAISLPLNVQPAASKIRNIVITLTSHNGLFETNDNWNIQSVYVTGSQGGSSVLLANAAGNPLVRLTGSQPGITLNAQPNPPPIKASDVYFWSPSDPEQHRGRNTKPATSIVAKNVTLRGWLVADANKNDPNKTGAVFLNASYHCGSCEDACGSNACNMKGTTQFIGYEDALYGLILDPDFILSTYGGANSSSSVLSGAVLHGNPTVIPTVIPPFFVPPLQIADIQLVPNAAPVIGVDINSFWIPPIIASDSTYPKNTDPIVLHLELNAWHTQSSQGDEHNYQGRGPAPPGWVECEYPSSLGPAVSTSGASDNWWPFRPDAPGAMCDGMDLTNSLHADDYVEVTGTLWQDDSHPGPPPDCWKDAFPGQDGWLEIHPVDSIRFIDRRPSPFSNSRVAAIAGIKRSVHADLCANPEKPPSPSAISFMACPEGTYDLTDSNASHTNGKSAYLSRTQTTLRPSGVELVDGRFTNALGLPPRLSFPNDCAAITAGLAPGSSRETFKATYLLWWTSLGGPPPPSNLQATPK